MRRLSCLSALLLSLVAAVCAPVAAQAEPASNSSTAANETDGASVFDFAFAVEDVTGDAVDQRNGALAFSSCEACQTVAVAIQIVLVSSKSTPTITPVNESVSLNQDCVTCSTLATAYQFVYGNGGPVRLTPEGKAKLRLVRRTLEQLGRRFEAGELTTAEVKAQLEQVRTGIRKVLATELVPVGRGRAGRGVERGDGDLSEGPTGAGPSAGPGEGPAESPNETSPRPGGGSGGATDPDLTEAVPQGTTTTPAPGAGTVPAPATP